MNLTGKALAILMTFVLGLGVAACGSDSDSDSGSAGDTAAQTTDTSTGVEGVDWQLMNIVGDGFVTSLPQGVPVPTINFENGEVQVFTGCNSGMGTAEVGESSVTFGPIAMTKKACDDTVSQVEFLVTQVLKGEVPYKLGGGTLSLTKGKDGLVYSKG
jgi:heat shock protein HslJ